MPEANVETLRRWVEAYNRRDIHGLLDLSDPDIEFRSIFAAIESGGVFRGPQGVFDYFAAIEDAYERFTLVPERFVDAGAAVIMEAIADWRGRGSGATDRTPVFPVAWFRAGKVLRAETFARRDDALHAAGWAG